MRGSHEIERQDDQEQSSSVHAVLDLRVTSEEENAEFRGLDQEVLAPRSQNERSPGKPHVNHMVRRVLQRIRVRWIWGRSRLRDTAEAA